MGPLRDPALVPEWRQFLWEQRELESNFVPSGMWCLRLGRGRQASLGLF